MRFRTTALIARLLLGAVCCLLGQSLFAQTWNLPQGTTVKDNSPRTYRISVDYNTANTKGETAYRQRVTGDLRAGWRGER